MKNYFSLKMGKLLIYNYLRCYSVTGVLQNICNSFSLFLAYSVRFLAQCYSVTRFLDNSIDVLQVLPKTKDNKFNIYLSIYCNRLYSRKIYKGVRFSCNTVTLGLNLLIHTHLGCYKTVTKVLQTLFFL